MLWDVCLIVLMANWTLSSKVNPSSKLALVYDSIVRMAPSTNPVPIWRFGVHRMRFIFSPSQNSFKSLRLKQLPLSVRMVRGLPLSEQNFVLILITVRVSVFSQNCAVGHLLKLSTATKIQTSPRVLDLIEPAKSKWTSLFGSGKRYRQFFPYLVFAFKGSYLQLCSWGNFRISPVCRGTFLGTRRPPLLYPFCRLPHVNGVTSPLLLSSFPR